MPQVRFYAVFIVLPFFFSLVRYANVAIHLRLFPACFSETLSGSYLQYRDTDSQCLTCETDAIRHPHLLGGIQRGSSVRQPQILLESVSTVHPRLTSATAFRIVLCSAAASTL